MKWLIGICAIALITACDDDELNLSSGNISDSIFINEVMSDNSGSHLDPDNNRSVDWVELYNSTDSTIDVAGMYLSDDQNEPDMFRIPDSTYIDGNGYLIIYCDLLNETGLAIHTNFALNRKGEEVRLYDANLNPVDWMEFSAMGQDRSFGRARDGVASTVVLKTPTPGAANIR